MSLETPNTGDPENEYEYLQEPNPAIVLVRFNGNFQSRSLVWEASILTLQHAYEQYLIDNELGADSPMIMQSYISVFGPSTYQAQRKIEIALDTSEVQHPTILKTIIMVRQYKNLRLGRHAFGVKIQFPENRRLDLA